MLSGGALGDSCGSRSQQQCRRSFILLVNLGKGLANLHPMAENVPGVKGVRGGE
jgi:hypothetical protein